MDAFKGTELARMEMGGNEAWREFWEATEKGKLWDAVELQEKYGGAAGEEWKERLGCKVEGKDFVGMPRRPEPLKKTFDGIADSDGPGRRAASPAGGALGRTDSRKAQNEKFFARLGNANADRPAHLAPSQGGKYGGFGGGSSVSAESAGAAREPGDGGIPGVEEFQKDPVAALTKGFGWFTTTVGKGAKTVNEGWIQPTAQKVSTAHDRLFYVTAVIGNGLILPCSVLPFLLPANANICSARSDRLGRSPHTSAAHCRLGCAEYHQQHQRRSGAIKQVHR